MKPIVIKNAKIVNEGLIREQDLLINDGVIEKIDSLIDEPAGSVVIDGSKKYLFPGAIDDQVHFREPGLTHKATIATESKAAVAGGVTSYMEMPNTIPNVFNRKLLEDKYEIARRTSLANYSFYMGASNDNMEEVLRTDVKQVCGVKIFMGSSTGNMLVDNEQALEGLFSRSPMLIATHCEDEKTIRENLEKYRNLYGDQISPEMHPLIRSAEACYRSSSLAVELATRYGTRLHVLHISTARETGLFSNAKPLAEKKITAEACVHHLWFDDSDYVRLGNRIKWNPAIKTPEDRSAVLTALLDDRIDVIATDHAPHTIEEKALPYLQAPSGGPLIQHSLVAMIEMHRKGLISLEKIAEKMAHAPAVCFRINRRGFIREGYHADLVLVDPDDPWTVGSSNILYKCGWSPFEGEQFSSKVCTTIVSGHIVYNKGYFDETGKGKRLQFDRI